MPTVLPEPDGQPERETQTLGMLTDRFTGWLRYKLHTFLRLDDQEKRIVNVCDERITLAWKTLERARNDELTAVVQMLQDQIDSINALRSPAPQPKATEQSEQIMPGHTRFTARKRQWEAEHRRPASTPAGEQIKENNRIIASGERQPPIP